MNGPGVVGRKSEAHSAGLGAAGKTAEGAALFRPISLIAFVWLAYQIIFAFVLMGHANAAGSFDGSYTGKIRLVVVFYRFCSPASTDRDDYTVVVENDHFVIKWGSTVYNVNVEPDGSFDTFGRGEDAKPREISGKITGSQLEADMGSNRCASHLSLIKRSAAIQ